MSEAIFGKYRLVAELGHGGMADVYLAVARGPVGFNKLTVIKRLKANLVEDPEFVTMLLDEARLAARLNHPNVVQTTEVGEEGKQYFIAMEYLDGQPFHRVVVRSERKSKKMSLGMSLRVIADVLAGLHYAHELTDFDGTPLNVVHRDATPHNVFVTYDGQVKVVDFGIAKAAGRESETRTGIVKGKVTYMGPEHAMGQQVDRRADVFSIGVMLWEAVAGTRMWKNVPDLAIVQRLIMGDIPKLSAVKADVPEELERIVQRSIAAKPDDRYQTALEFQNDLEQYMEKSGERASNRELGQYVAELFADRRAELRQIIETQLADLKTNSTKSFKPVRIEVENPQTTEGEGPASSSSSGPLTATAMSARHILGESSGPTSDAAAVASDKRAPGTSEGGAPAKRSPVPWIALALVAGGAVAWFGTHGSGAKPAAQPAAPSVSVAEPAPPPSASASAAPAPAKITLTLKANPADAHFSLDDGPALTNPYIGQFPKDGGKHTVKVEASGYKTKTVEITFADDVLLDLALERDASTKPATRTVVVTHPAPATTPTQPASTSTKPKRHIDTDDPWH